MINLKIKFQDLIPIKTWPMRKIGEGKIYSKIKRNNKSMNLMIINFLQKVKLMLGLGLLLQNPMLSVKLIDYLMIEANHPVLIK